MDMNFDFSSFGLVGVIIVEEVDLLEVVEVDVRVEVKMENWLSDNPVRFCTYHRLDSDHRS